MLECFALLQAEFELSPDHVRKSVDVKPNHARRIPYAVLFDKVLVIAYSRQEVHHIPVFLDLCQHLWRGLKLVAQRMRLLERSSDSVGYFRQTYLFGIDEFE